MEKLKAVFGLFCVLYLVSAVNAQANCATTGAGRFADPNDVTCKNYTLCVLNTADNSFLSYNYVCPTTSLFNPATALCTTNYVCNATAAANPPPAAQICTADSIVPDPNVTDCSSYVICVADNGTFDQSVLTCPTGLFNPATTLCDQTYVCPVTAFTCTTPGRFPDPNDATCQNYFFCVAATNGTVLQYNYTCPTTSVFSPTTRLCTTTYVCPTAAG